VTRTKQNSIDQRSARRASWIALLLVLLAAPAYANRIIEVRVGNHPTFTRLVFELDASTGYQVERQPSADGAEQLTVTLEASTQPREIESKSVGIRSVKISEGAGQAIAQIQLRKPGLQMKEMILSNPPRIVLDFVHSAAAVAELKGEPYAKPAPVEAAVREQPAVEQPKPKPSVAAPKAEPKPAVAAPKPAPKAEPKPEPVVAKAAEEMAPPQLEPIAVPVEPTPPPQQIAKLDSASDEAAAASAGEEEQRAELRDSIPGVHKRTKARRPADASDETARADLQAPLGAKEAAQPASDEAKEAAQQASGEGREAAQPASDEVREAAQPASNQRRAAAQATADQQQPRKKQQRQTPSPADISRRIDAPKAADSSLPFNAITLAGIAVAAIVVLFVAVRLYRRRALPNDLDVTTLADASSSDDDAGAEREAIESLPDEVSEMGESPEVEAAAPVEERETAAYSLNEVAAQQSEAETEIGLYDEDSEGEKAMDMDTTNLPTERDDIGMPPTAVMSGVDDDISQLVQELASRVANLEARLDEANESRERLERQVAAQSEELRVQRAAIARTQRALRSLSRAEEDQATEPALREPSQPAR